MSLRTTVIAGLLLFPGTILAQHPPMHGSSSQPPTPSASQPTAPPTSAASSIPSARPVTTHSAPSPGPITTSHNSSSTASAGTSIFSPPSHMTSVIKLPSDGDRESKRAGHERSSSVPPFIGIIRSVFLPKREPKEHSGPGLANSPCQHEPCTQCLTGQLVDNNGKCSAAPSRSNHPKVRTRSKVGRGSLRARNRRTMPARSGVERYRMRQSAN